MACMRLIVASGLARVGLHSSPKNSNGGLTEETRGLNQGPLRDPTRASPLATTSSIATQTRIILRRCLKTHSSWVKTNIFKTKTNN